MFSKCFKYKCLHDKNVYIREHGSVFFFKVHSIGPVRTLKKIKVCHSHCCTCSSDSSGEKVHQYAQNVYYLFVG